MSQLRALNASASLVGEQSVLARLARGSFYIYFFFVLFGTSLPFQEELQARDSVSTSNLVNQLLSLLFLVSLVSIIGKQNLVIKLLKAERYLILFMGLALVSVAWSDYPMVSLKRWIALFGEVVICVAALIHFKWSEVALRPFRLLISAFLILSFLSVLFIPGAMDPDYNGWRGLTDQKNNLGLVTMCSTLLWFFILRYQRGQWANLINMGVFALSIILLIGSNSKTSLLVFAIVTMMIMVTHAGEQLFEKKGVAAIYTAFLFMMGMTFALIILFYAPHIVAFIFGLLGKDLTFTGRVDLWQAVFGMTQQKWVQGWGIGGFWVMDSPRMIPLFEVFLWLPNQAHNGYLDVFNQLGVIGLMLFVLMLIRFFKGCTRLKKRKAWVWIFVALLILNLQETTFFRPRHFGHFMFIFTYLAIFVDLVKEKKRYRSNEWYAPSPA